VTKIVYRKIKVNGIPAWRAHFTFGSGVEYDGIQQNLNDLIAQTFKYALHDNDNGID
jgi:hypothetical protein